MRTIISTSLILLSALALSTTGQANELALPDYLRQVKTSNPGLLGAEKGIEAARHSLVARDLLTAPYLFTNAEAGVDRSPSLSTLIYGDDRQQKQWSAGLEERTGFGLNLRLAMDHRFTSVQGAYPLFISDPEYYTAQTSLFLSQDLWRNDFGREVMSRAGMMEAQARAEWFDQRYQVQDILVQAEGLYWKTFLAEFLVQVQEDLLVRAEAMSDWAQERVALKLLDRSDLLQAQGQAQLRRLELAMAKDERDRAHRAFNQLRDLKVLEVESLKGPVQADLDPPLLPEPPAVRLDVQAQEQRTLAAQYQAVLDQEGLQPELKASVSASLNGLQTDYAGAVSDSWETGSPTYGAWVEFRLPLDFTSRASVSEGFGYSAQGETQRLAQRRLEAENDWLELKRKLQAVRARLALAITLESLQKEKAEHERERLRRGNTVTFQVLQFEQDWALSRKARLALACEFLVLKAQTRFYAEERP